MKKIAVCLCSMVVLAMFLFSSCGTPVESVEEESLVESASPILDESSSQLESVASVQQPEDSEAPQTDDFAESSEEDELESELETDMDDPGTSLEVSIAQPQQSEVAIALICPYSNCTNIVSAKNMYCGDHKCLNCDNARDVVAVSYYCVNHRCSYESCPNVRDGFYCFNHTCVQSGCKEFAIFSYCVIHDV